eukprot:2400556-Amphidinium_carterae.1
MSPKARSHCFERLSRLHAADLQQSYDHVRCMKSPGGTGPVDRVKVKSARMTWQENGRSWALQIKHLNSAKYTCL